MSYKTYIAQADETVFDMALKLYKDARGISDILLLNPTLDLEATTYFGQEITYDDAVVYKREIFAVPLPEPSRPAFRSRSAQTPYDLAIQIYGDISNLDRIIAQVGLDDPEPGTEIETEVTDNFLANALFSQKIVATSPAEGVEIGGNNIILEDGASYVLTEDGSLITLE